MVLATVILAAGQGKRMHSSLAKVLHCLAGKPLLEHVVQTASKLYSSQLPIVVYGHQGDIVQHLLSHLNVVWVKQSQQLGTGHALLQASSSIPTDSHVLVLYGDVPLISYETLKNFISTTPAHSIGIMTANLPDPTGFGRIIRDKHHHIIRIVEEKDANSSEQSINEINSGIYLIPGDYLKKSLPKMTNKNAQQEYYLTDLIAIAAEENIPIHSTQVLHYQEILGVNDQLQLAKVERYYQCRMAEKLMCQGVTLRDPQRFDIRGDVTIGRDVIIDVNVILEGHVKIGNQCSIGPNTLLRNVTLGDKVTIKSNCVIEDADIESECIIGPFARLRPGTRLASHVHIGNFVEIKNSAIHQSSKINHLSYIGDSDIGAQVNIGAGAITCNYDGINKHRTLIGNQAFIGTNTTLIAPVEIGEGAYIAAGSTITRHAPAHQLTIGRAKQRSIENWGGPKKKVKEE